MRILLLDDNVRHRRAGKRDLEALGHEVVALCEYTEAMRLAAKEKFDVALIDLLMPAETTTLGPQAIAAHAGIEIGVGFPMAIFFAKSDIPLVICATDTNHHNHPMSAIVDWVQREPLTINNARVLFMHAPLMKDGAKDWVTMLAQTQHG